MFDDEADTISINPDLAFETTQPLDCVKSDTLPESLALDGTDDSTDLVPVPPVSDEDLTSPVTVSGSATLPSGRPGTNADWPPTPKQPAHRKFRRAGVYKAISITKLNSLKR